MFDKKINKRGFSLGEVMVATFILMFGIVSSMALTTKSTTTIIDSRNATIASLLAQEGVELVRNVRDNNVTNQTCGSGSDRCTAFEGDKFPNNPTNVCSIGYTLIGDDELNCNNPKSKLFVDENNYSYSHSQNSTTSPVQRFERNLLITFENATTGGSFNTASDDINDKVAVVTSVVVWGKGEMPNMTDDIKDVCKIGNRCVFAQTKLTSWINYK